MGMHMCVIVHTEYIVHFAYMQYKLTSNIMHSAMTAGIDE